MRTTRILVGDVRTRLAEIPDASVQTCVTSPPYWGLRDYGCDGQIGLEQTPEEYVAQMVAVFADVRRCLRDDGTLWLNIGDSYAVTHHGKGGASKSAVFNDPGDAWRESVVNERRERGVPIGLKTKDLVGIPWMLAFALRADGWYLRSDIIWSKPNPMPESVRDRPTKAHEYVFLLSKSGRYFYDLEAIREDVKETSGVIQGAPTLGAHRMTEGGRRTERREYDEIKGANARTVWTIATQPFPGSHFAVMPPELAEKCIRAGSAEGDTVLDPFGGAGTTAFVANRLGRDAVICELNPEYAEMARERIREDAPLWNSVEVVR